MASTPLSWRKPTPKIAFDTAKEGAWRPDAEPNLRPAQAISVLAPRRTSERRYSDRPLSPKTRISGIIGAACVCMLIAAPGMLHRTDPSLPRRITAAPTIVEFAPPRAPRAARHEKPPGPQKQGADRKSVPTHAPAARHSAPPLPVTTMTPPIMLPSAPMAPRAAQTDAAPRPVPTAVSTRASASRTTAPPSHAAPPAEIASDARPKWEARLLAALNQVKRYPADAARARQNGVVRVRFLVDRRGRVHKIRLARSSGFAALDTEALALPERAQPLPRPPAELGGARIELIVPVAFFMRQAP